MLNHWITDVVLYRGAWKHSADDLGRPSPEARGKAVRNVYTHLRACVSKAGGHFKCQTPLHEHRLWTCCTTPPTDELTTILQLVIQQICHIAMPETNISTCQDVGMWKIFVRWWWICCTTSCRTVVSLSVGGVVQHIRSRCPCSGVWHLTHYTCKRQTFLTSSVMVI